MKEGLNITPFLKTSRYLDKSRFIIEALEALFRVKGEQGRKKVVVTCFN